MKNRSTNHQLSKKGIGKTSLDHATVAAKEHGVSLWNILANPDKYSLPINNGTKSKISDFVALIKSFATKLETDNAYVLAKQYSLVVQSAEGAVH